MPHARLKSEDIGRRGYALYEGGIRAAVEIEPNIGRLVSIDVETGAFVVADDEDGFHATDKLNALHPDAAILTLRIGYNAVYTFGGLLERTAS